MSLIERILRHCVPHTNIYRESDVLYLTRFYLLGGPRIGAQPWWRRWNLYLHVFHVSDDPVPHSHPWNGYSLILNGKYFEWRWENGKRSGRYYKRGQINRLATNTFHYVLLETPRVWTLFLAGPRRQSWGFMTEDGFVDWHTYTNGKGIA